MRRALSFALFLLLAGIAMHAGRALSEPAEAPPPPPEIPGITAEDPIPEACVGCHVNRPDLGIDARFSTLMKGWSTEVDAKLVAKVQGAMPEGVTLKGKHPTATRALADVPAACIRCHKANSKAPPFQQMVHLIHLTGGEENHFLTLFRGQCTLCHKLDAATGAWSVPSGAEKEPAAAP